MIENIAFIIYELSKLQVLAMNQLMIVFQQEIEAISHKNMNNNHHSYHSHLISKLKSIGLDNNI